MPILSTLHVQKNNLFARLDQEMIGRIKKAFEILRAPYFRASVLNSRGVKHSPNLWQEHHHKAKDALHGCPNKKRTDTSIWWDRWQDDQTYRQPQLAVGWSDAWVRYSDHTAPIDISHTGSTFGTKTWITRSQTFTRRKTKTIASRVGKPIHTKM